MPPDAKLSLEAPLLRQPLAAWFEAHQRILPWRTERTLYRTVVSEFMLQQTQVSTVLPYFDRWMKALPDFAALAAAPETVVLRLWEGLGYYRRARFLHQLARDLIALPQPPSTAAGWRGFRGVGDYTAAAIASLEFGEPVAVVDGNVVRILARLTRTLTPFDSGSSAVALFRPLAQTLVDAGAPGRHNEAMMELGATVCVRGRPRCLLCPLAAFCAAHRAGDPDGIPRLARPAAETRAVDRVWRERGGALLMRRIPEDASRMRGLHELPTAEEAGVAQEQLGQGRLLATHRRTITRFRITERIYQVDAAGPSAVLEDPSAGEATAPLVWVPLERLDGVALSGPHRRWITALLRARGGSSGPGL